MIRFLKTVISQAKTPIEEVDPPDISGLTLSEEVQGEVVADWDDTEADTYKIYRSTTSESGYNQIGTSGGSTFTDDTVVTETTYYYKVRSVLDGVDGELSEQVSITTQAVEISVGTITGFSVEAISDTEIDGTWGISGNHDSYIVEMSLDGSTGWTEIATPTDPSFSKTGLTADTTYYFRVRAVYSSTEGTNSGVENDTTNAVEFIGVLAEFDYTVGVTTPNSNVSEWTDQSTKGNDSVQVTSTKQPAHSDADGITFDGSDTLSLGDLADFDFQQDDDFTVLIKGLVVESGASGYIIGNSRTDSMGWHIEVNGGVIYFYIISATGDNHVGHNNGGAGIDDGVARDFLFVNSAGGILIYKGDGSTGTGEGTTDVGALDYSGATVDIGSRHDTYNLLTGSVKKIQVWNKALNYTERLEAISAPYADTPTEYTEMEEFEFDHNELFEESDGGNGGYYWRNFDYVDGDPVQCFFFLHGAGESSASVARSGIKVHGLPKGCAENDYRINGVKVVVMALQFTRGDYGAHVGIQTAIRNALTYLASTYNIQTPNGTPHVVPLSQGGTAIRYLILYGHEDMFQDEFLLSAYTCSSSDTYLAGTPKAGELVDYYGKTIRGNHGDADSTVSYALNWRPSPSWMKDFNDREDPDHLSCFVYPGLGHDPVVWNTPFAAATKDDPEQGFIGWFEELYPAP